MLQPAINVGIAEADFWEMTKAEVERHMEGAVWRLRMRAQFDYKLADLIGVSVARIIDGKVDMPDVHKAYSVLFDNETLEEKAEREESAKMESSINNFLAFANKHNAKLSKGVENNN